MDDNRKIALRNGLLTSLSWIGFIVAWFLVGCVFYVLSATWAGIILMITQDISGQDAAQKISETTPGMIPVTFGLIYVTFRVLFIFINKMMEKFGF